MKLSGRGVVRLKVQEMGAAEGSSAISFTWLWTGRSLWTVMYQIRDPTIGDAGRTFLFPGGTDKSPVIESRLWPKLFHMLATSVPAFPRFCPSHAATTYTYLRKPPTAMTLRLLCLYFND